MPLLDLKNRRTNVSTILRRGILEQMAIKDQKVVLLAEGARLLDMTGSTTPLERTVRTSIRLYAYTNLEEATGSLREPARACGLYGLKLTNKITSAEGLDPSSA